MTFVVDLLLHRKKFPLKKRPPVGKSLAEGRHLALAKSEATYLAVFDLLLLFGRWLK